MKNVEKFLWMFYTVSVLFFIGIGLGYGTDFLIFNLGLLIISGTLWVVSEIRAAKK